MTPAEFYMQRCIQLAELARGKVAPNPLVGAVLVHDQRIIGEGYHEYYGGPHAEVNCIRSVKQQDENLIENSVLYVSLEPCAHFGKTPPCVDLIIKSRIKKVVIGHRDPFAQVNGKGIEKLQSAGIEVIQDTLQEQCKNLNKRFFTFHTQHRPYVILKWAQTQNGRISGSVSAMEVRGNGLEDSNHRLYISNEYTNRIVHKWRAEEASILVGTNTALLDDPELTNRYWPGSSPIRLVIDMDLKLPSSLKMFKDDKSFTIVFNSRQHNLEETSFGMPGYGPGFYQVTPDVSVVQQVIHGLYQLKIQSVLVEGGGRLLQSFIDEQMWDEARVITNSGLRAENGIPAPVLTNYRLIDQQMILSDQIHYFMNKY